MNLVNILAAIIGANVLERYPHIRIAFGESGCGLDTLCAGPHGFRMGDRFTDLGLKMKPSDYWRRQCKATFHSIASAAKLIDDMGAESLMWGSDYPHGDGVWPHSDKYIKEQFAEVSPEVTRMITCTNAGKFYGADQLVFGPRASRPASFFFSGRATTWCAPFISAVRGIDPPRWRPAVG